MSIKAKIKTRTPCEVIIECEVERADLDAAYERTYESTSRYVALPGFRTGKAPREMVEQHFKKELQASTVEELVGGVIRSVVKQNSLNPVTGARLADEAAFPSEGSLKFTVEFEVAPAIKLGNYEGISLKKRKAKITDQDVDDIIDRLLEQHATFEDAAEDRAAEFGDWLVIDYTGAIDGAEVMKRNDAWIEVSSDYKLPLQGFAQQLVGAKKGDTTEFTLTAPADHSDKEVAGKTVAFSVVVKELRERRKPQLTDELAEKIDPDCKSVDDLRDAVRKNQLRYKDAEEQHRLRELAREALVREHEIPLPPSQMANRARRLVETEARRRMQQGESQEQIKNSLEELGKQMAAVAEHQLRAEYVLNAIAAAQQIEVSDEDILPQLQYYASAFRRDVTWVRKTFEREGHMEALYATARENKALDWVIEKADVVEN